MGSGIKLKIKKGGYNEKKKLKDPVILLFIYNKVFL